MDLESKRKLVEAAVKASKMSRRDVLGGMGAGAAALTTAGLFTPSILRAQDDENSGRSGPELRPVQPALAARLLADRQNRHRSRGRIGDRAR